MGYQDDYQKLLKIRYKQFISLKNNKQSTNYKDWFFKYVPKLKNKINLSKTQKHISKNKLNKSLKKKTRQDKWIITIIVHHGMNILKILF